MNGDGPLETAGHLQADDIAFAVVATCYTALGHGAARGGVDIGVFQVKIGIAQIDRGVLGGLVLQARREPPTIRVRQGGWAVIRVMYRRLIERDADFPFPLRCELVVGANGDTPSVAEVKRQRVGGAATVVDLQFRDAAPAGPETSPKSSQRSFSLCRPLKISVSGRSTEARAS